MEDHCVMCGEIVPEGTQVCPNCIGLYENKNGGAEDNLGVCMYSSSSIGDDNILYTYTV